jgi:hypothetical protein
MKNDKSNGNESKPRNFSNNARTGIITGSVIAYSILIKFPSLSIGNQEIIDLINIASSNTNKMSRARFTKTYINNYDTPPMHKITRSDINIPSLRFPDGHVHPKLQHYEE